jgi:hypothetical protein
MDGQATIGTGWDDSFLESMRTVGDPLADGVIAKVIQKGDAAAVNSLMRTLVQNEYPAPEALDPAVREYLSQTSELPAWADANKIARGEQVFWRYGPRLILILHCYSLPFCYAGRKGVQVLALTGRLSGNPARRVIETAQMLVDVMQPGGLTSAAGRGRRTIQKVRLMHAAVRHLTQLAPEWKAEYGLPVNQEDLAGTLMSFSWIALDGLRRSGIQISPEDQEAYLHSWRVAGALLGIRDDINPEDMASAALLTSAIARREFAASPEGKMMTDALVKSMQYTLPGDIFDGLPALFIRYFLGEEHAKMIGIEAGPLASIAALPLRLSGVAINDILTDSSVMNRVAEKVGRALIEAIVFVGRGGNRPSFSIPLELKQQWGVNWVS